MQHVTHLFYRSLNLGRGADPLLDVRSEELIDRRLLLAKRLEVGLRQMPDQAVFLGLGDIVFLLAMEEDAVAEKTSLRALIEEFSACIDQSHSALSDDRQTGRRVGFEADLALWVIRDFQPMCQRLQLFVLQRIERQNRVQELGGKGYVVHPMILRDRPGFTNG